VGTVAAGANVGGTGTRDVTAGKGPVWTDSGVVDVVAVLVPEANSSIRFSTDCPDGR